MTEMVAVSTANRIVMIRINVAKYLKNILFLILNKGALLSRYFNGAAAPNATAP